MISFINYLLSGVSLGSVYSIMMKLNTICPTRKTAAWMNGGGPEPWATMFCLQSAFTWMAPSMISV